MADKTPTIGVLALQETWAPTFALEGVGAVAAPVKTPEELAGVAGLVIPGGESTTVGMLLERFGLMEPLRDRIREGLPVFGTCTGLILMAKEIEGSDQPRIGCMDVAVRRNACGRQVDSFEAPVEAPVVGTKPVQAVFIRAPRVTRVEPNVEVLAETEAGPVLVLQGSMLGTSFHPELTDDRRIHALFVEMTRQQ